MGDLYFKVNENREPELPPVTKQLPDGVVCNYHLNKEAMKNDGYKRFVVPEGLVYVEREDYITLITKEQYDIEFPVVVEPVVEEGTTEEPDTTNEENSTIEGTI
jgi:hypothetical protein